MHCALCISAGCRRCQPQPLCDGTGDACSMLYSVVLKAPLSWHCYTAFLTIMLLDKKGQGAPSSVFHSQFLNSCESHFFGFEAFASLTTVFPFVGLWSFPSWTCQSLCSSHRGGGMFGSSIKCNNMLFFNLEKRVYFLGIWDDWHWHPCCLSSKRIQLYYTPTNAPVSSWFLIVPAWVYYILHCVVARQLINYRTVFYFCFHHSFIFQRIRTVSRRESVTWQRLEAIRILPSDDIT